MTRKRLLAGLAGLLVASIALGDARAGDPNFENRYRELRLRREQDTHIVVQRPWGGPTTPSNWWTKTLVPKTPPHPGPCPGPRPWPRPPYPYNQWNLQYNQYYYFAPFSNAYVGQTNFFRF